MKSLWKILAITLGAILGLQFLFTLTPSLWIIKLFYVHPVSTIAFVIGIVCLFYIWEDGYGYMLEKRGLLIFALLTIVFSVFWFSFSKPFMMHALYKDTEYEKLENLIPITEMRSSPYAQAYENFRDQNPDTRFGFHDLDYVQGRWIADFSPTAGITPLTEKTSGFFIYSPENQDTVTIERQRMPFAEGGTFWNSEKFWINSKFTFAKYTEMLYIKDPDTGGYMAVTSLTYRKGVFRVPYVKHVLLIHGNGEYELLSTIEAEQDPRLEGIQIMPEWLAALRAEAYGWKEGPFSGVFTRKGRIDIQRSEINKENSAPYLLQTEEGMHWYAPFSPRRKESLKGIAIESAENINSPVLIWELPKDQAYRGVDALTTVIKGGHTNINWLKVSENREGNIRAGDTDIIELLPCPKEVDGQVELFYCGYVATDPPKTTRFFTIINARTQEIYQDVYDVQTINDWLQGKKTIPLLKTGVPSSTTTVTESLDFECGNPASLTDIQIIQCIQLYAEELEKRK